MALDHTAADITPETARILSIARDSVQQALFLYLMTRLKSSSQTVSRFGRLLMLIVDVAVRSSCSGLRLEIMSPLFQKVGALLSNMATIISELTGEYGIEVEKPSRLLLRFLTAIIESGGSARRMSSLSDSSESTFR